MKPTITWINTMKNILLAILGCLTFPLLGVLIILLAILGLLEWFILLGNSQKCWGAIMWLGDKLGLPNGE